MAQQLSTNTFTAAKWIVSPDPTQGTHTTIQGAINSASSGDGIFLRAGTYTEDITLKAGIDIRGARGDGVTPIVIIIGNATYAGTGNATISEVRLQTNAGFVVTVSGANASVLHILSSDLHCTNHTGISFTNSNAASQIFVEDCTGNLTTTGIAFHTSSSVGTFTYRYSSFSNTGLSTTQSTNSAGAIIITYALWFSPLACSGAGTIELDYTELNCAVLNVTALTTAGTGTSITRFSDIFGGTASAASIGAGTTVSMLHDLVNSSNTNAITGAGTLKYTLVGFTGSSSTINTTTQIPLPLTVQQGGTFASTLTQNGVLIGNGTNAVTATVAGTTGQVLTGVTGSAPTFQAAAAGGIATITGDTGGALSGSNITFAGGATGLSFGGAGTTETLTFAGITANGGTVSLATDATTSTINVGTGAGAKTTTLGSTNTTSSTAIKSGSGNIVMNSGLTVDSTGRDYNRVQPAFSAYLSSPVTNVTGDSTLYTVICDTALFDQNSNYNTGTGLFTAPVTGRYQFNISAYWTSVGAGFASQYITINSTLYNVILVGPGAAISAQFCFSGSMLLPMTAGDTASLQVRGSGITKIMGINGAAGGGGTFFSGFLAC